MNFTRKEWQDMETMRIIKSVFLRNGLTGTRPKIDRFVKNHLPTGDDLVGFKEELDRNPKFARDIMTKFTIRKITYTEYINQIEIS